MNEICFNTNLLENVKSKLIMKRIVNNLHLPILLKIIKYSKITQQKLDIGIDDYELYNKIEIEIIPINNYENNKFIFFKPEDKDFYHIYFNDEKNEIQRTTFNKKENVKKIKVLIDKEVKYINSLFQNIDCIEKINFIKFGRRDINDLSEMFYGCSALKELNISKLYTYNVTKMDSMFSRCTALKELNLNNFNTDKVTDMNNMFSFCSSLKELNLNNFKTNNVIDMHYMFTDCLSLKQINLSNFNTNKVTNMWGMFSGCSSLKELNLNNFYINKSTDISCMFRDCSSLKKLYFQNLSSDNINNRNNINISNGCMLLKYVDIKKIDIDDINKIQDFFKGCPYELISKIETQLKNKKKNE